MPFQAEPKIMLTLFNLTGQGLLQFEELLLAFLLSALVGLEREIRQKSAGLRTYTLVGVSAALFMLVSKYGFTDVLVTGRVVLDPSRVAAQVVSGIGFIGGGVIFMRRDVVRGLTTAASVWLTAALGMACGAGLTVLAVTTTVIHFIVMIVFPRLLVHLPRAKRTSTRIRISYQDGRGLLRDILIACTQLRFAIDHVDVDRNKVIKADNEEAQDLADFEGSESEAPRKGLVSMSMQVKGKRPVSHLIARLSDIDGVSHVGSMSEEAELE
jgi:putative Mg2+ transporter-C (MgtC) family protein